jgi:phosphoglycolate phosphatase-like HAD superfamily hydrolase/membrane associated rhomboid family serine protease
MWHHLTPDYYSISRNSFFIDHQYWRACSSLFYHADGIHLASNIPFLAVFGWFLYDYFGIIIFPLVAILCGMAANLTAVCFYSSNARLIGSSGMVYAMAALWGVLYIRFASEQKVYARVLRAAAFALVLLCPPSLSPGVSYAAHAAGFLYGAVSAFLLGFFIRIRDPGTMRNLIIFDFDGVLADTLNDITRNASIAAASAGIDCTVTAENVRSLEKMEFDELGRSIGIPDDRIEFFVKENLRLFSGQPSLPAPFDSIPSVVEKLAKGNELCIISGNSKTLITRFLSMHGLQGFIPVIYDKDDSGTKEEKILQAMERYGMTKSGCIMVGDSLSDITAAKHAGIRSVAALWGNQRHDILKKGAPDFSAAKPSDLIRIFSK